MKKFLSLFLSVICLLACASCGDNFNSSSQSSSSSSESSDSSSSSIDDGELPTTENVITTSLNGLVKQASWGFETESVETWGVTNDYVLETAVRPIWTTRNVYNETVSFIGKGDVATLMYTPTKIHKVYDYYLQKEYIEGVDYVLEGNKIRLTDDTSVNHWDRKDYYYAGPQSPYTIPTNEGYLKFSEVVPNTHQISICYEHEDTYKGAIPVGQEEKFSKVNEVLKNGGTLNICAVGDSITKGCGSSDYIMKYESARHQVGDPYKIGVPSYINLVKEYLDSKENVTVNLCNTAVGGTGVSNGLEQMGKWTIVPDLVIIAFGMNDASVDTYTFYERTKGLIEKARELNPDCEILLLSSMIPNPEVINWLGNIAKFEEQSLLKLLAEYNKVGLAPMTSVSQSLYGVLGKKFEDLNSNSINHPNDFVHRIYAQTVLTTLLGNEYYK